MTPESQVWKKYRVNASITISVYTDVQASSPEEALQMAQQRDVIGLCHFCAEGNPDGEWSTNGSLDGEPEGMQVEEA